ncbi:MAG: DUF2089 domain-containing protein [Thermaceae bacterium]|nr:DUF2089 domain-containing protein [Thermaceae bacterium]
MKIYPMPTACPACGSQVRISGLICANPECRTEIRGEYAPNEFALLPPEQLEFMRLYIKTRGNLRKVGGILGVSYPTVLSRFNGMLRTLGYEDLGDEPEAAVPSTEEKDGVLAALEKGEISATEAAERLRGLKKR